MSAPTIRDDVLAAWRRVLLRAKTSPDLVDALVLELEAVAEGHGARLPRRPRPENSNALGLQKPPPAAVRLPPASGEYQAARAAMRAANGTDTTAEPTTDHLPPLPTTEEH